MDPTLSIKKEAFWTSATDRTGRNTVYEFLTTVFDSFEYDNAVTRALAIPTCRMIPYFRNHVDEIKTLLLTVPQSLGPSGSDGGENPVEKYFLGEVKPLPLREDEEFIARLLPLALPIDCRVRTPVPTEPPDIPSDESTEPLLLSDEREESGVAEEDRAELLEQIQLRAEPAVSRVATFIEHHDQLCRELPHSLLEYLRAAANSPRQTKTPLYIYQPSNLQEQEEDYEVEIGNYNPVQPLFYDHGISIIPLSSKKTNAIDHHILQLSIISPFLPPPGWVGKIRGEIDIGPATVTPLPAFSTRILLHSQHQFVLHECGRNWRNRAITLLPHRLSPRPPAGMLDVEIYYANISTMMAAASRQMDIERTNSACSCESVRSFRNQLRSVVRVLVVRVIFHSTHHLSYSY
uniref:Uncharacterized protein n=1 Tax=Anopheles culicifacies TaxID=139723 RepID=A0A182MHQ5_9DIPT